MEGDQKLKRLDKAGMWVSVCEMSILLIALTITLYHLCRYMRFKFLIILICLLMLSDLATIFLSIGLALEETMYHEDHTNALTILIGGTTVLFNFGNNSVQWLFATKYWIIAREVPKLFEGRQIKFNERTYKMVSACGFIINLVPCILLGYFRAELTLKSANFATPPEYLTTTVQILYQLVTSLQLVSAIILADALRRI